MTPEEPFKRIPNPVNQAIEEASKAPEARNGLIKPEQIVYAEEWRRKINPEKSDMTVLYGGIGPDISLILRTTEAKTIYGIDWAIPSEEELKRCLQNWDTVDTKEFPFKRTSSLERRVEDGELDSFSEDAVHIEFEERLQRRRDKGNWDNLEIDDFTIERLVVLELKKMEVDPKSIEISQTDGVVILSFVWGGKVRTFQYIESSLHYIDKGEIRNRTAQVDVAVIKSVPFTINHIKYGETVLLDLLDKYVKRDGVMLYGATFGTEAEVLQNDNDAVNYLNSLGYSQINYPEIYTQAMLNATKHLKNNSRYGWQLFGVRKKA